jgi:hypothetical protein
MEELRIVSPIEYRARFCVQLEYLLTHQTLIEAGFFNKITLRAMYLDPSDEKTLVMMRLIEQVIRETDVRVHIEFDSIMDLEWGGIPHLGKLFKPRAYRAWRTLVDDFKNLGKVRENVSIKESGKWRLNCFAGTDHSKAASIRIPSLGLCVAWIGGVNFHPDHFHTPETPGYIHDMMLEITGNSSFVHELQQASACLDDDVNRFDRDFHTDLGELLVDKGVPRRSLILQKVLEIIQDAEPDEALLICTQFRPTREIYTALCAAVARSVVVEYRYSPEPTLGIFSRLMEKLNTHARFGGKTQPWMHHYEPRGVSTQQHAKMLIKLSADDDTPIVALMGSHNFSEVGVAWGTREIALHSTHPQLLTSLVGWYANAFWQNN